MFYIQYGHSLIAMCASLYEWRDFLFGNLWLTKWKLDFFSHWRVNTSVKINEILTVNGLTEWYLLRVGRRGVSGGGIFKTAKATRRFLTAGRPRPISMKNDCELANQTTGKGAKIKSHFSEFFNFPGKGIWNWTWHHFDPKLCYAFLNQPCKALPSKPFRLISLFISRWLLWKSS